MEKVKEVFSEENMQFAALKLYEGWSFVRDHLIVIGNKVADTVYNGLSPWFVERRQRFVSIGYLVGGQKRYKLVMNPVDVKAMEEGTLKREESIGGLLSCDLYMNGVTHGLVDQAWDRCAGPVRDLMPRLEQYVVNEEYHGFIRVRDILSDRELRRFRKLRIMLDDGECTEKDVTDLDAIIL